MQMERKRMREQMKTGNHLLFGGSRGGAAVLGLELLNEILHALHVLAVLLSLECEFFESPVGLPEVLAGLGVAALLGVEFSLELTDAGLQLGNDALTSLEG